MKPSLGDVKRGVDRSVRRLRTAYQRRFSVDQGALKSLAPRGPERGRVLFAHVVEAFFVDDPDELPTTHNHFREARAIADAFLDLGYRVDVISFKNRIFEPKERYDVFVSSRVNFDRIGDRLNDDCLKLLHLDVSHWAANNAAALARVLDVQARRGVTIPSVRIFEMNQAIERSDVAMLLGNEHTHATYAFAGKPVFQVPNPAVRTWDWDETKDFARCGKEFVWLGSAGLLHKGLDLALEAFARMPDLTLHVCGPIDDDRAFVEEYRRELDAPNVVVHGWTDIAGDQFRQLARRAAALVYPSCAEGAAGAVVSAMHVGLVPVVSAQSGVDVAANGGVVLEGLTVDAVVSAVRRVSAMDPHDLRAAALATWTRARHEHTIDHFRVVYGSAVRQVLDSGATGLATGFVRYPVDDPQ